MSVKILAVSYNLPKFCPSATWSPTVKNLGPEWGQHDYASGVFVNTNNTIAVTFWSPDEVRVSMGGSSNPAKFSEGDFKKPASVFATVTGAVYTDGGEKKRSVERFSSNLASRISVMTDNQQCFGLFIDINNTLYCSMNKAHQVIKKSLNYSTTNGFTTAAGSGSPGGGSNQLNSPYGIFVNTNFTLFVADYGNNRIQRFDVGNSNGVTVVLNGLSDSLCRPSGVILDAEGYLFIADSGNSRIIGSGPKGFRVLIDHLKNIDAGNGNGNGNNNGNRQVSTRSMSLSFDNGGNIYITGAITTPLQKVTLATNSCGNFP